MDQIFQDFSTVPDGTAVNGFVMGTGQTIVLDITQIHSVNTATVQGGLVTSPGLMYAVVPVPWGNVHAAVEYVFPSGSIPTNHAICIALGKRDAVGNIITGKMIHIPIAFQQRQLLSLWGSAHGTSPGDPNAWDETSFARAPLIVQDANVSPVAAGTKTRMDVIKAGNDVRVLIDGRRIVTSYWDTDIDPLSGDTTPGSGDGYVYFEIFPTAGGTAPLPQIASIMARKLSPVEVALVSQAAAKPQIDEDDYFELAKMVSVTPGAAPGIFSITPVTGGGSTLIQVDCYARAVSSDGHIADEKTKFIFSVGDSGAILIAPNDPVYSGGLAPVGSRLPGYKTSASDLSLTGIASLVSSSGVVDFRYYSLVQGSRASSVPTVTLHYRARVMGYQSPVSALI